MIMNFLTTGTKFPYTYYLGIKSASKVGDVKLWYTQIPNSEYFIKIIKELPSEKIEPIDSIVFKERDAHWNLVSTFDNLMWKIVSQNGGTVMGLDSLTIKPFVDMIGGFDTMTGRDSDVAGQEWLFAMHGTTCKKDSIIASEIYEDSCRALRGEDYIKRHPHILNPFDNGVLRWGGAGYMPFLNAIYNHPDIIKILPYGMLGGYKHDGSSFYLFEKDGELLNPDCRTIPFYATSYKKKFDDITPQNVKDIMLGKLIEQYKI